MCNNSHHTLDMLLHYLVKYNNSKLTQITQKYNKISSYFDTIGNVASLRKKGSGRPRSARTEDNVSSIEELVLSQEEQRQTHRFIRQISREIGVPKSSVLRIVRDDLNLKCVKKRRAQELTQSNRAVSLQPCNAPKSCCKCSHSQMTKWTLSGSPMRKFTQCLHRGIRKMTVCTFQQESRRSRLRLSVCCTREQRSVGR